MSLSTLTLIAVGDIEVFAREMCFIDGCIAATGGFFIISFSGLVNFILLQV